MNFLYRLIFLFIFLALYSNSFSQPHIEWQKCLGGSEDELASSIQQTSDGGYIIVGSSYSINGDLNNHYGSTQFPDIWIVKLFPNGLIQWQRSLGGSSSDDAVSIQQTSDGGYIVLGTTCSFDFDVDDYKGFIDCWIIKLDSIGSIQWEETLGGSDEDYACSIQQTFDGGYIFAGWTESNDGDVTVGLNCYRYWIVKLDSNGQILWQKSLCVSDSDRDISIKQTSDNGYIIVSDSYSYYNGVTDNHGGEDYWIIKLSSFGEIQWQKSYGGSQYDAAKSIQQTNDGGYIIAGYSASNDGDVTSHKMDSLSVDFWIVKIDTIGNIQWQKSYGGDNNDMAYSIQLTIDGGYIIAGLTNSTNGDITVNHSYTDYWIIKLDSIGNLKWQKSLGGSQWEYAVDLKQTKDLGYIIAGYTYSRDGDIKGKHGTPFTADYWIVKLSPDITDVKDNTNLSNIELSISPNPASDNISISFPGGINQSIHIYNSLGIEMKRFEEKDLFEKNSIDINVEGFPSGIYYVMQDIGCLADIQCLTKSFVVIR